MRQTHTFTGSVLVSGADLTHQATLKPDHDASFPKSTHHFDWTCVARLNGETTGHLPFSLSPFMLVSREPTAPICLNKNQ